MLNTNYQICFSMLSQVRWLEIEASTKGEGFGFRAPSSILHILHYITHNFTNVVFIFTKAQPHEWFTPLTVRK